MRSLRDLLTTWENWSARNTLTRALARTSTDGARRVLDRGLAEAPDVDPLDALRDSAKLVALLSDWQWQVVHAARSNGAAWRQVGEATGVDAEQARTAFGAALSRIEEVSPGSSAEYRDVL